MKVTSIRDYKRKSDDKPYWRIDFEDLTVPCLMFTKPQFKEGDELPDKNFRLTKNGEYYVWASDGEGKSYPKRAYGKSAEEIASIEQQVDKKIASEIYCHITEVGTPFDKDKFKEIYRVCRSLNGSPIVKEAKKQYGAVED